MDPDSVDYRRGKLAFEAYRDAVGGVSAVSGDPLPEFADTGDLVKAGWVAAALAVAEDVLVRPPSDGAIPRPTPPSED